VRAPRGKETRTALCHGLTCEGPLPLPFPFPSLLVLLELSPPLPLPLPSDLGFFGIIDGGRVDLMKKLGALLAFMSTNRPFFLRSLLSVIYRLFEKERTTQTQGHYFARTTRPCTLGCSCERATSLQSINLIDLPLPPKDSPSPSRRRLEPEIQKTR
jgi:hypothetical protein